MSWSRRAVFAASLGALLSGCGFTAVYGPAGGGTALRGAILAAEPDTDFGFAFVRQFEERLGLPDAPRWTLDYVFAAEEVALAIDGSNNITRFNLEGALRWTLSPTGSDVVLLQGTERSFTAYSASGSTISTLASERDAERRLAVILADKVVARLLAEAPLPATP
ncbi:LPS assembly lipoprotein LptE [Jannaschia sp. KMU-145]|uniref:LPS assembly lipoprotein LptE n=1 Tax=Jannaschia halovivens TaxID=3388667 RepID=UPI00396B04BD